MDESPTIEPCQTALPNLGSARGYDVIEAAKRELEKARPGIVSCADVLSVAARDASAAVGGPSWTVKLGRRDSTTASHTVAETELPGPFDNLNKLITMPASLEKALIQETWLPYLMHIPLVMLNVSNFAIEFMETVLTLMPVLLALEDANVQMTPEMEIWQHLI
nr:lignin-forming anionic peroxidase-like [Ipomoea batatas]